MDANKGKRVVDQETLPHTDWNRISDRIATKHHDLKDDFDFIYREVSVGQIILSNGSETLEHASEADSDDGVKTKDGDPIDSIDPVGDSSGKKHVGDTAALNALDTLKSVRLDKDSVNIALDTEFETLEDGQRAILSWQFAFFPPGRGDIVVEVVILPKGDDLSDLKRIKLAEALGVIFDMEYFEYKSIEYSKRREYVLVVPHMPYFKGDTRGYTYRKSYPYPWLAEGEGNSIIDRIYQVNSYHCETQHDYKKDKKAATHIQLVCHNGVVDLSTFADDPYHFSKGSLHTVLEYVTEVQKGCISLDPVFETIPSAKEYWKFYPIKLSFRDTMCLAPAGGKSLKKLGEVIGVPKLQLPDGAIDHMATYRKEALEDFLAYAVEDALVTLLYGSELCGVNKQWIVTATSGSGRVLKDKTSEYFSENLPEYDPKSFDAVFRGVKKVQMGMKDTPAGLRPEFVCEQINAESKVLDAISTACYMGGYNACFVPGLYDEATYDYDIKNAYPTAMCLVSDIDYSNPFKDTYSEQKLTLDDIPNAVTPFFANIDFEFPSTVLYPCIPQFVDGNMIYTQKGKGVYATGPEIYLALKLGAEIFCHLGYSCNELKTSDESSSHSLAYAVKQVVKDRAAAEEEWGKKGLIPTLLKLIVNGAYGKTAQDVDSKSRYLPWTKRMDDIGPSCVTCPEKASMVTSLVRSMLLGVMNELHDKEHIVYSVTTDGFISDCDIDTLNACSAYGIGDLFRKSRAYLEDKDCSMATCWSQKHEQAILLNITTRGNIGYGCYDSTGKNLGVLAHNSFKSGEIKDSDADRQEMFTEVLTREGPITSTDERFSNIKDILTKRMKGDKKADFYTKMEMRHLHMDFDLKRKPCRETMQEVHCDGIHDDVIQFDLDTEIVNFLTVPYETVEEYQQYRKAGKSLCLRTSKDWERFYLRLGSDSDRNYHIKDPDWKRLQSVIAGYRQGLWDIPTLDDCKTVDEKLARINGINKSGKEYTRENWKDAGRKDRKKSILNAESIKDLLNAFGAQLR